MNKYVYSFNEGSKEMKSLLGGKGANLAEMTKIGLPVPFGFTVTTEACNKFYADRKRIDDNIVREIFSKMVELEEVTEKTFGDEENPLLVSVRSGAVRFMPGMIDTVLNLGLNDETVVGLIKLTNNENFAYDSYKKLIKTYSEVVMGVDKAKFESLACDGESHQSIIEKYKALYKKETGTVFPQDPETQLIETIKAVFRSWDNERAVIYRKQLEIPFNLGTAVNVQAMVFGNAGDDSGAGIAYTRNPKTGEKELYGEFLINAKGEDIFSGKRETQPICEMEEAFPRIYKSFQRIASVLEKHYKDMQNMAFTIENGRLYMLQTQDGKRTPYAAVNIAVDMEEEGLINKEQALMRIVPDHIEQLLRPIPEELKDKLERLLDWADEIRTLKVRTNANNPKDVALALNFGAEGIGLCRTEHMFFQEDRIAQVKRIISDDPNERKEALAELLPFQKNEFKEIFELMGERPVTIRLLDPHFREDNPMLGHRGCRLSVIFPEVAQMQAEAIMTAAIEVKREKDINFIPEIMIPLVAISNEFFEVKKIVEETIEKIFEREGMEIEYQIGTMMETPRAVLVADKIAEEAEFFSFGTNDLTQMAFGFSKEDTGDIIKEYVNKDILKRDPFKTIDQEGVGRLMEMAIELGKKARPNIKLGICGEHGGETNSVEYCHRIGLNYVSCSPYRVPVARIAAAQAVLKNRI